jgi:hypothetical protein
MIARAGVSRAWRPPALDLLLLFDDAREVLDVLPALLNRDERESCSAGLPISLTYSGDRRRMRGILVT